MLTVKSSLVDTYSNNNRSISLSSSAFGRSISLSSTVFRRSISTLLGRCCSQKNRWISQTSTVTSQISRRQTQGSKRRGKRARLRGKFLNCACSAGAAAACVRGGAHTQCMLYSASVGVGGCWGVVGKQFNYFRAF